MVNLRSFGKAQYAFLAKETDGFGRAVRDGVARDSLKDIARRYFMYFPVEKDEMYQPTEEEMAAVNVDLAIPEIEIPEPQADESVDDYKARMAVYQTYQKALIYRREVSNITVSS